MKRKRSEFLAVSQLKQRGWNNELIDRLLGEPDEEIVNPHYRSGPRMRLYRIERIERAENTSGFREANARREARREAARKALATKEKRIQEYVSDVIIKVPRMSKEKLVRSACANYNALGRGEIWASENSDQQFLERICVNYLRHCLTEYDKHLTVIAGKVGVGDAYVELKIRILHAISDKHGWLLQECIRQEHELRRRQIESLS
jgi:hypothetical protein